MRSTRSIVLSLLFATGLLFVSANSLMAQDAPVRHARKYKPPPDTSHIVVQVVKNSNGKPISNAAVVFNPTKDGKDEGSLEVKTDPDGKAIIDVIPTGSTVRIQIIANGFATWAEDYVINEPTREFLVKMLRPREQLSAYQDNSGKASDRKPGVQEPNKPSTKTPPADSGNATPPAKPADPAPAPAPNQ